MILMYITALNMQKGCQYTLIVAYLQMQLKFEWHIIELFIYVSSD